MTAAQRALAELVGAKEMVVVCGSGGVGKTTTAAALGAANTVLLVDDVVAGPQ